MLEKGVIYAAPHAGRIFFMQYLGTYPESEDIFKMRRINRVDETFVFSDKEVAVTRIYAEGFRKWEDIKDLGLPYKNWRDF